MLLIILISKLLINKDSKFSTLNKYPMGSYLSNLLVKLNSIWHVSGTIWIFFIIFSVIIFSLVLIYSNYSLLAILQG